MTQRFYYDGKLTKSIKGSPEQLRKWIDNAEKQWSKHIGPLIQPGEFDPNNGHEIMRISVDELLVTTTGNHKLRYINVE